MRRCINRLSSKDQLRARPLLRVPPRRQDDHAGLERGDNEIRIPLAADRWHDRETTFSDMMQGEWNRCARDPFIREDPFHAS
jgi:hypothetical protein